LLISNLFIRHKVPQPRIAPGLFLGLIAVFILLGESKPLFGLAGIGTTVIVAAVLVELNRTRIWEDYRKSYRKQKGLKGLLTEPNQAYYTINVVILWPAILLLGVLCVWAAYILT
jgi:hypothetical protein